MEESHVTGSAPVGLAVVGASAGGVEALKSFAARLPADLGCPVVVVLHVSATGTSVMPQILARAGPLPAVAASDGEVPQPGRLYVAPPDRHVLVTPAGLRLSSGPRVSGHRPAIDPAMQSAAATYGARAVGIVLSGTRDDGAAGLAAIKAGGGRTLVQNPDEALFAEMPRNAMAHTPVDAVMAVAELARWLARAAAAEEEAQPATPPGPAAVGSDGESTPFACPVCGAALSESSVGGAGRLECPSGHAYAAETSIAEHGREVEWALCTATRALDDRVGLLERLAARARVDRQPRSAAGFERQADEARMNATVIRRLQHTTQSTKSPPAPIAGPTGA